LFSDSTLTPQSDGASDVVSQRLDAIIESAKETAPGSFPETPRNGLKSIAVPTLAHLLALFVHPPASFPPKQTSLIVIDGLSTLFDVAYQRNFATNKTSDASKWAAGRKYAVMSDLMSKLGKMAALNNIAMVLTCQTVTRLRTGASAILLPALSGLEWDNGISTQLVIFRDWPPSDRVKDARWQRVRFVGAIKVNGALLGGDGGVGTVVPFTIEKVRYGNDGL